MIGFIEKWPKIEPHNGLFRLTIGEQTYMLTRHAFTGLTAQCTIAEKKALIEELDHDEKLVPFPKPTRRRRRRTD